MADAGTWRKITPEGLFRCGETDEWDRDPSAPHIIRIGDTLRMYYHGRLDGRIRIGFAEAPVDDPTDLDEARGQPGPRLWRRPGGAGLGVVRLSLGGAGHGDAVAHVLRRFRGRVLATWR